MSIISQRVLLISRQQEEQKEQKAQKEQEAGENNLKISLGGERETVQSRLTAPRGVLRLKSTGHVIALDGAGGHGRRKLKVDSR